MPANASFRTIPFWTQSYEATIGRRVVVQEYPFRDLPTTQDLGRKARTFTIEAHVIGDDYDMQRNALQHAIETAGNGELIHPLLGRRLVTLTEGKLSERHDERRLARFSLTFVEVGEGLGLIARPDHQRAVEQSALDVAIDAKLRLLKAWQLPGASVITATRKLVERRFDQLQTAATLVRSKTLPLSQWTRTLAQTRATVLDAVRVPSDLANELHSLATALQSVVLPADWPVLYQRQYTELLASNTVRGDTPKQTQALVANQAALVAHEQATVLALWGNALLVEPKTREAAELALTAWLAAIDQTRASEPDLYSALTAYQAVVIPAVRERLTELPPLERVEVHQPMPLLAVAYAQQGTQFDEAQWLHANPNITHPLRLPQGDYWGPTA